MTRRDMVKELLQKCKKLFTRIQLIIGKLENLCGKGYL